jgi:hypothetical protein
MVKSRLKSARRNVNQQTFVDPDLKEPPEIGRRRQPALRPRPSLRVIDGVFSRPRFVNLEFHSYLNHDVGEKDHCEYWISG